MYVICLANKHLHKGVSSGKGAMESETVPVFWAEIDGTRTHIMEPQFIRVVHMIIQMTILM